jgi:DNA-3-methyladenine glycosylase II
MPYKEHLIKDKKLKKLVETVELTVLKPKKYIFIEMVSSIISQQLSVKVADVIFTRFMALYNNHMPLPEDVLATEYDILKAIGLSNQKTQYILNIAEFATKNNLEYKHLQKMDNETLIAYLTQIKGVGRWTVEMLMMFALARPDVFSLGDYGLQMGAKKLYNLDDSNKKEFLNKIEQLSKKWMPYRSYAARLLWKHKDAEK